MQRKDVAGKLRQRWKLVCWMASSGCALKEHCTQEHHHIEDFTTCIREYGGSVSTWQRPLRKTTERLQIWLDAELALWRELPAIAKVHFRRDGWEGEDQTQTLQ